MSGFSQVILASGYYAAFKVTLLAKALEGFYDGAVHITTDYEVCVSFRTHVQINKWQSTAMLPIASTSLYLFQILTIPVKALIAVGTLSCSPKHIILPPSFPVSCTVFSKFKSQMFIHFF